MLLLLISFRRQQGSITSHVRRHADGSVEQQKFNVALSCISVALLHLQQSGLCCMELRPEDPANG